MLGALVAFLCVNDTQLHQDLIVRDLANAENYIGLGQYAEAREILDFQQQFHSDEPLRMRTLDLRALVALRAPKAKERTAWVLTHIRDRAKANKRDVRYQAWLAEALLAEGRMTESLVIINELKNKDLMPDAFAYIVLARLSIGEQREAALAECRTRAEVKSICVFPKPK